MKLAAITRWIAVAPALAVLVAPGVGAQIPKPEFLYKLADFSGDVPYNQAAVKVDVARNETYVGESDAVWIYNHAGMQEFGFFLDPSMGVILDIAPTSAGDLLVLSFRPASEERPGGPMITLCDFRGASRKIVEIGALSDDFAEFSPNQIIVVKDALLLVSHGQMKVVRTDMEGVFQRGWDLARFAEEADPPEPGARPRGEPYMGGFGLDRDGRFLFTISVRFRAFRVDPETGESVAWGKPGSSAGKFGIVAGIAGDAHGYTFVADRGRGVVIMFDPNLRFVREFGGPGPAAAKLTRPGWIAYGNGRLYVTQMANRGISVFSVEPQ